MWLFLITYTMIFMIHSWLNLWLQILQIQKVQFSCSVMSVSLWPHEPQHARPPCPSPTPRVHPNPPPLSRWCHPTVSFSVIPFSSCPQSFTASGSFQMSQLLEGWLKKLKHPPADPEGRQHWYKNYIWSVMAHIMAVKYSLPHTQPKEMNKHFQTYKNLHTCPQRKVFHNCI